MKIALIGNSHIACVKLAYENATLDLRERLNITFFGAPGSGLADLKLKSKTLLTNNEDLRKQLAMTSGGLEKIDLDHYDAIILMGMYFSFSKQVIPLFANHTTKDLFRRGYTRFHLMSNELLKLAAYDALNNTLLVSLARKIESVVPHIPLIAITEPCYPSRFLSIKTTQNKQKKAENSHAARIQEHEISKGLCDLNLIENIYSIFIESASELGKRQAFKILFQPSETFNPTGFTKDNFNIGGVGINKVDPQRRNKDFFHMNEEYGELLIKQLLDATNPISRSPDAATNY